jgi:F0F1-type ATP synthase membrane subunit a
LLYMFSFFSLSSFKLTVLISIPLLFLLILEFVVSGLQAYIFSSLAFIYISETLLGSS